MIDSINRNKIEHIRYDPASWHWLSLHSRTRPQVFSLLIMAKRNVKLIQASRVGNVDRISHLLTSKRANVNCKDSHEQFPLLEASKNGHVKAVERLIEGGADIDLESQDKVTSLSLVSECGHHEIVKILIEKGANIDHQVSDGRTR